MKGNEHLEYSHCVVHRYKTLISFRSQQNARIFTIFYHVNCKSDFVIYLLECKKCHIQYVGKAETDFNLRLNSHRKDVYKADVITASRHFAMKTISLIETQVLL